MMAVHLALFYKLLGYTSYQLNVNCHNNTHAITVVKCGEDWIVEDACFNYVLNSKQKIIGLSELIEKLRKNDDESICFIPGIESETFAVSKISPDEPWTGYYPKISFVKVRNGNYLYKIDRTFKFYKDFECMQNLFIEDGYTRNLANEILYVETIVRFYCISDFFKINSIYRDINELKNILGC